MFAAFADEFSGVRVTELEVQLALIALNHPHLDAKYDAAIRNLGDFAEHVARIGLVVADTADCRLGLIAALDTFSQEHCK
jgi:hypothetical protein